MIKNIDINEIQKDLSEYCFRKYGIKFQIAGSQTIPETSKEKGAGGEKEIKEEPLSIHFDMKPLELKAYLDEYIRPYPG